MARSKSDTKKNNAITIYAGMLESFEKSIPASVLGDLFSSAQSAGASASLSFSDDYEVQRALTRIGVLAKGQGGSEGGLIADEFVRNVAKECERTPAQISIVLRLFASGMYGVLAKPICGAMPKCKSCKVTKLCKYFNKPPKDAEKLKIPPAVRLESYGAESLSDEELLMVLLGAERVTEKTKQIVNNIFDRFASLRVLSGASFREVSGLASSTKGAALRIIAASALHKRISEESRKHLPIVRWGNDFYDLYRNKLRDMKKENFYVVLLDSQNRIIRDELVSLGGLTQTQVIPREVFRPAIQDSAAAVAFVHNHPSGSSKPSKADILLTKRLVTSAELLGLQVLDHVIIGEECYTSFLDEKLPPFDKHDIKGK